MIRTLILMLIAFASFFTGCKKDKADEPYSCTSCKTTPDAVAANDASSKGIYKGVVIGSSGTIVFDVMNAGSTITAKLTIDGTVVNLTSTVTWTNGQPYVGNFTGTMNGQPVSINFSVGLSGTTPTVTSSNIPGHPNAVFMIVKETSTSLIECFEGTYTGTQNSNTLNLVLARSANIWGAKVKTASGSTSNFSGAMNGTALTCNCPSGTTINGIVTNDEINGTFNDSNQSGTWKARRTM